MRLVEGVPRSSRVSQTVAMPLEFRVVLEVATAQDVITGMVHVVALLRRLCFAARVEWWAADEEGELWLAASDGVGEGERRRFPLGPVGEVVIVGSSDPRLALALAGLAPVLRRRCAEERLVCVTTKLARRNQALEDFAALVAHELKTPLHAALLADDASSELERALGLVDSLLEVARDGRESPTASAADCLEQALEDLGHVDVHITAQATAELPLPPSSLRVIMRNLLGNAVAAGARRIHVVAERSATSSRLLIVDDGVGLDAAARYATGSGLGLSLCRRIADRYGGVIELAPRSTGGTRATLRLEEPS
jgi:signal transduction histidine kinase